MMIYTLRKLSEVPPPAPVTRLLRRTREVVLFDGRSRRLSHGYRVDLDRCRTAEELLGWIEHLCGKTWCTPRHIAELIRHVEQQNGVTIGRGA